MLGFLIGVSIAVFVVGCYLIIKNAKETPIKKPNIFSTPFFLKFLLNVH